MHMCHMIHSRDQHGERFRKECSSHEKKTFHLFMIQVRQVNSRSCSRSLAPESSHARLARESPHSRSRSCLLCVLSCVCQDPSTLYAIPNRDKYFICTPTASGKNEATLQCSALTAPACTFQSRAAYCTATRCNTLQHTATHCNTLPYELLSRMRNTATHCSALASVKFIRVLCVC